MIKAAVVAALMLQVLGVTGLGHYHDLSSEDAEGVTMAQFAVPLIQKHIKSDMFFTLQSVDKVHKQLVSGTNYRLKVSLVETNCRQDAGAAGLQCKVVDKPDRVTCHLQVYDIPWTGHRSVTRHQCSRPHPPGKQAPRRKHGKHSGRRQAGKRLSGKHLLAEFGAFVHQYQKAYNSTAEYRRRMKIFAENVRLASIVQRMEKGSAKYGVTKFSDLTAEEWRANYLGLDTSMPRPEPSGTFRQPATIPEVTDLPKNWDWRQKGAVTNVKDQGSCGSCWAFSVTGNVEGQYFLKHNKLIAFSEQELVDCDTDDHGCQGGMPDTAYKFIEFLGGLESEKDYPYEGRNDQCRYNRSGIEVKLSGSLDLPKDEEKMQQWLYAHGPISVGVNANLLMFYRSGVIHGSSIFCRPGGIDHGVLVVGYGEKDYPNNKYPPMPFWILKNSWGPNWGENGFFRFQRGDDCCGVAEMASSAVVV